MMMLMKFLKFSGHHEFSMAITGNGVIAKALKLFTKGFSQKKSLHVETSNRGSGDFVTKCSNLNQSFDVKVCLPVPMFTPAKSYFQVYAFLVVILAFYFVEPRLKKYRSIVAGFIFRKVDLNYSLLLILIQK